MRTSASNTQPSVLNYSVEQNLEPTLAWLKAKLELDNEGVCKLAKRLPQVLCLNIKENLGPKLVWIKARLELDDEGVCKRVKRLPAVLGDSID